MKINIKKKNIFIKTQDNKKLPIYITYNKYYKNIYKKRIIIVIEEIFGLNNNIKYICKYLAKHKYIAIAPELFFRIPNLNFNTSIDILRHKINKLSDKKVISDLNTLISWSKHKFKSNNIAMTGLSWGGRITWLYSYFNEENIKTSIIWYGRIYNLIKSKNKINPINIINKIKIPILCIYGLKDNIIPKKDIKIISQKLDLKKNKIITYKNAKHSFLNKKNLNYNKKIKKKSLKEMLNWLKLHLK